MSTHIFLQMAKPLSAFCRVLQVCQSPLDVRCRYFVVKFGVAPAEVFRPPVTKPGIESDLFKLLKKRQAFLQPILPWSRRPCLHLKEKETVSFR